MLQTLELTNSATPVAGRWVVEPFVSMGLKRLPSGRSMCFVASSSWLLETPVRIGERVAAGFNAVKGGAGRGFPFGADGVSNGWQFFPQSPQGLRDATKASRSPNGGTP